MNTPFPELSAEGTHLTTSDLMHRMAKELGEMSAVCSKLQHGIADAVQGCGDLDQPTLSSLQDLDRLDQTLGDIYRVQCQLARLSAWPAVNLKFPSSSLRRLHDCIVQQTLADRLLRDQALTHENLLGNAAEIEWF